MTDVRVEFTTRRSGASRPPYDEANLAEHVGDDPSAIATNRSALAEHVGAPLVWMRQVHGNDVAVVRDDAATTIDNVDALVTTQHGLGLAVLVADCVPVVLADAGSGVIGVAHVGRRGLVARTARRALEAMCDIGAHPADVEVWLGPSICGRCYELPAAMRDEVEAAAPGSAAVTTGGLPSVDLRAGLRGVLLAAGVHTIHDVGPCTAESDEHYSYRRDGVTGRFAGVVALSGPRPHCVMSA